MSGSSVDNKKNKSWPRKRNLENKFKRFDLWSSFPEVCLQNWGATANACPKEASPLYIVETTHCVKYRNFFWYSGEKIFLKLTVSRDFGAIRPKLSGNSPFMENYLTRKVVEVYAFYDSLHSDFPSKRTV